MHGTGVPSDWVTRWAPLILPGGRVLDLACGAGRHLVWLAQRGHVVTGLDRDPVALGGLVGLGELITADIETDAWPLVGRQFDAVVVTNYLWRPLLPAIAAAVAPGGLLIYETFAVGHERVGRPTRADFLLRPGELLTACNGLRVLGYEDGFLENPPRFVQRVAAVRARAPGDAPSCWRLPPHPSAPSQADAPDAQG